MAEEIIYKKGYVFFIDILGFKKLVETESAAYIKKLIDYFHDFFLNGDFAKSIKTHWSITQVSDCIVISFEEKKTYSFYLLLHAFFDLQTMLLTKENILIRGACCYGDIYHTDKHLFGTAYQNAYQYEENFAIYPRIIVIPEDTEHLFISEREHCKEFLKLDTDGLYYLDYINIDIADIEEDKKQEYLDKLKEKIEQGKKNYSNKLSTLIKYNWLENKYNEFIKNRK